MPYKDVVRRIKGLSWKELGPGDLMQLMVLAEYSAREFAESLRIALRLYPENSGLRVMAEGELGTDNLKFDSYEQRGDHADFLAHFISKYRVNIDEDVRQSAMRYLSAVRSIGDEVRAMTIFSREQELPGIFEEILKARGWGSHPALQAFRYYLKRHIELDTEDGGHADLISDMVIDDRVTPFYEARFRMYDCLFGL